MENRVLELREIVKRTGFEQADSMIHLFIGGSEAHGAKIAGTDDLDLYGIYIPAPSKALGIPESYPDESGTMVTEKPEHFVWSTASSKQRNGPDDVDFAAYSLRKWAGMAAKGNATALHFLFTPNLAFKPSSWEKHIRPNAQMFISSWAGFHFKAFAEAQLRRLNGDAGAGKHGQRPELTEQFGYDTKSAMHIIRILGEGIELMKTGHITLPRPEKDFLIEIRKGQYGSLRCIKNLAEDMFVQLDEARRDSKLPEEVNRPAISKLVADTYLDFWTGGSWTALPDHNVGFRYPDHNNRLCDNCSAPLLSFHNVCIKCGMDNEDK